MVKFVAIALVAFVALQASLVSARASGPVAEKSAWDTLAEDAQKALKDFADATGLSDVTPEKIVKKIDEDAKIVAKNVDAFVEKLKKDVDAKKPEVDKVIKAVQAELAKTSE
ncbi:hypothetical protein P5E51_16005, partial [Clostridium perfringens]|nr:hypothetical protein [Clostridium perfringens]